MRHESVYRVPVLLITRLPGGRTPISRDMESLPGRMSNAPVGMVLRLERSLGRRTSWSWVASQMAAIHKG
jgi:hypothetical protein